MMDVLQIHAQLWEQMQQLFLKNRLPQALLFINSSSQEALTFVNRLIAFLMCTHDNSPCGGCRECHLLTNGHHPDAMYIQQETPTGMIKIEQLRHLQQSIYQSPQRGKHRFIVLNPAERMNASAANAILKILEEPPEHTIFILIAEQIENIPTTVLSRCQKYRMPSSMGLYSEASPRAELIKQLPNISHSLCDLIEKNRSPCKLAAEWSVYSFEDILWVLYLLNAEVIQYQLLGLEPSLHFTHLVHFSQLFPTSILFKQLDEITAIVKKLRHNINMNQTLVLENLLVGYAG